MIKTIPKSKLDIGEDNFSQIATKKIGETFKVNLSFTVIEKTKSFVILSVDFIQPENLKRIY